MSTEPLCTSICISLHSGSPIIRDQSFVVSGFSTVLPLHILLIVFGNEDCGSAWRASQSQDSGPKEQMIG